MTDESQVDDTRKFEQLLRSVVPPHHWHNVLENGMPLVTDFEVAQKVGTRDIENNKYVMRALLEFSPHKVPSCVPLQQGLLGLWEGTLFADLPDPQQKVQESMRNKCNNINKKCKTQCKKKHTKKQRCKSTCTEKRWKQRCGWLCT